MSDKKKVTTPNIIIPDFSKIKIPNLDHLAEQIERINRFSELVVNKNLIDKLSSLKIPDIDLNAINKSISNIEKFEKALLKKKIVAVTVYI